MRGTGKRRIFYVRHDLLRDLREAQQAAFFDALCCINDRDLRVHAGSDLRKHIAKGLRRNCQQQQVLALHRVLQIVCKLQRLWQCDIRQIVHILMRLSHVCDLLRSARPQGHRMPFAAQSHSQRRTKASGADDADFFCFIHFFLRFPAWIASIFYLPCP